MAPEDFCITFHWVSVLLCISTVYSLNCLLKEIEYKESCRALNCTQSMAEEQRQANKQNVWSSASFTMTLWPNFPGKACSYTTHMCQSYLLLCTQHSANLLEGG